MICPRASWPRSGNSAIRFTVGIPAGMIQHGRAASANGTLDVRNTTTYHSQNEIIYEIGNLLGVAGDLFFIFAWICAHRYAPGSCPRPVYNLIWFSLGDLIKTAPFLLIAAPQAGTFGCTLQAFLIWYGYYTSSLWLVAYAHAMWRHFQLHHKDESRERRETLFYHAFIWIVPAVFFAIMARVNVLGVRLGSGTFHFCSVSEELTPYFDLITFVPVFLNTLAFGHVVWIVHKVKMSEALASLQSVGEAGGSATLLQQVSVWPRLLLYTIALLVAIAPQAIIIPWIEQHGPAADIATFLALIHGFLNALVYSFTHTWFFACCRRAQQHTRVAISRFSTLKMSGLSGLPSLTLRRSSEASLTLRRSSEASLSPRRFSDVGRRLSSKRAMAQANAGGRANATDVYNYMDTSGGGALAEV